MITTYRATVWLRYDIIDEVNEKQTIRGRRIVEERLANNVDQFKKIVTDFHNSLDWPIVEFGPVTRKDR